MYTTGHPWYINFKIQPSKLRLFFTFRKSQNATFRENDIIAHDMAGNKEVASIPFKIDTINFPLAQTGQLEIHPADVSGGAY